GRHRRPLAPDDDRLPHTVEVAWGGRRDLDRAGICRRISQCLSTQRRLPSVRRERLTRSRPGPGMARGPRRRSVPLSSPLLPESEDHRARVRRRTRHQGLNMKKITTPGYGEEHHTWHTDLYGSIREVHTGSIENGGDQRRRRPEIAIDETLRALDDL